MEQISANTANLTLEPYTCRREQQQKNILEKIFSLLEKISSDKKIKAQFYVFGGYVRDKINGDKPSDIDLFISNKELKQSFIEILKITGLISIVHNLKNYGSSSYDLSRTKLNLPGFEEIRFDIVNPISDSFENFTYCDFTCNNLIIDSKGNISTRCFLDGSGISQSEWTCRCINDATNKRLVWMIHENSFLYLESDKERISFNFLLKKRLQKMLKKGYKDSHTTLTSFNLWTIPSATCDTCEICGIEYEDDSEDFSIELKCNHGFHFSCLKRWDSCPTCHKKIEYKMR